MKKTFFSFMLLGLFGLLFTGFELPLAATPATDSEIELQPQSPTPLTDVESVPFTETVYNPCTNEDVSISGIFHTVTRLNFDANGIPHWGSATHFVNTSGVGLSSGIKYRMVGLGADCGMPPCVGERTVSIRCAPAICPAGEGVVTYTGVVRTRLIAQGAAPDIVIEAFFHITQNATGAISVLKQGFFNVYCQ